MLSRNRLLLNLINKQNSNNEDITFSQEQAKAQETTIAMGKLEAPEPEEELLSPRQQFRVIINMANKKLKKNQNANKKKKKVINQLIEYAEIHFPILEDEEEIF